MARVSAVTVEGLDGFRRDLREMNREWPRELSRLHRELGRTEAAAAQGQARRMGGAQEAAASAIKGAGDQSGARIRVVPGARTPMANTAFWGAKQRTGWFADPLRYRAYDSQHDPWVGNTWDVARHRQGPYAINQSLANRLPRIMDEYARMLDRLARQAFPN